MANSSNADSVSRTLGIASVGIGALAALLPKLFSKVYGISGDGTLMAMIRMWGTRNIVLGALNLLGGGKANRTLFTATTALSAADIVIVAAAGSDVAASTRVKGAATSALFTAAGAYVLTQD